MAVAVDYTPPNEDEYGPIPPIEAVLCEDMVPLLREYEATYRTSWASQPGAQPGNCDVWQRLSAEAGLPERRVYGIVNGESAVMDLDVADRLCMAIGKHISDVAVHPKTELMKLSKEQGQLVRLVARTRGIVIPVGNGRSGPNELATWRRRLTMDARSCQ